MNLFHRLFSSSDGKTRIACVGDSITYGTLVKNRRVNCYPARLSAALGPSYNVQNFGVNRHTMQKISDYPYWNHANFQKSSDFQPDIVLLMLGTNDSKKQNYKGINLFKKDCLAMIKHYATLPSQPQIYLMTPPTAYIIRNHQELNFAMSADAIEKICMALKEIAKDLSLPLIDIHAATAEHPEYFPIDGIHPNAAGAQTIADTVLHAISKK